MFVPFIQPESGTTPQNYGIKLSPYTKTKITDGIKELKNVVEGLEKLDEVDKFLSSISKLSGFLGVAGGLISFILVFIPAQESIELQYMKKAFAEVNMKLDHISGELDSIKDLITLETQRAQYIDSASKILHAYGQFSNYIAEVTKVHCSGERDCLRKRLALSESYVTSFNIKADLYKILRGTVQSTSVFGDPILDLIKTTYKCDIHKVLLFANGVIKLAFKAQQVILAHEKLAGTNRSIAFAMNDWSKMVYTLRKKANEVKLQCYKNIDTYIKADVTDTTYQTDFDSNEQAAKALKKNLDEKYPWLSWTILAYEAYGGQHHFGFESFLNMPNKDARKRVLRVIAQDKGTYFNQREKLSFAIDKIEHDQTFQIYHAEKVYNELEAELKKTSVLGTLSSLLVIRDVSSFILVVDPDHIAYYYFEAPHFKYLIPILPFQPSMRIFAAFESTEEIANVACTRACSNHGSCYILPRSSKTYCNCNDYFSGENCENYDQTSLASSVDDMLEVTAQIPKLTDVYFEILDMQNLIGASFYNLQNSISALDARLQTKYDLLNEKLTNEFNWANLITLYSDTIKNLKFYLHELQNLNSSSPAYTTKLICLANTILQPNFIPKWIYEINLMIMGCPDVLVSHKPLLFVLMANHNSIACKPGYKEAMDNAWRQLMVLQNQAYIMWAQAKAVIGH